MFQPNKTKSLVISDVEMFNEAAKFYFIDGAAMPQNQD
jgi:hypothetical protein